MKNLTIDQLFLVFGDATTTADTFPEVVGVTARRRRLHDNRLKRRYASGATTVIARADVANVVTGRPREVLGYILGRNERHFECER
jgi:hypothetical protein